MTETVRVYADRRLCIPVGVLEQYRLVSKGSKNAIWISHFVTAGLTQVMLSWNKPDGSGIKSSKQYDLSVRDRVLFKAPGDMERFKAGQQFNYNVNAIGIFVNIKAEDQPAKKAPRPRKAGEKRKAEPLKSTKRKKRGRPSKKDQLQRQFEQAMARHVASVLREDFPDATLAEVGAHLPYMTVGDLLNG